MVVGIAAGHTYIVMAGPRVGLPASCTVMARLVPAIRSGTLPRRTAGPDPRNTSGDGHDGANEWRWKVMGFGPMVSVDCCSADP
jgi:hypothetical protein